MLDWQPATLDEVRDLLHGDGRRCLDILGPKQTFAMLA